MDMVESRSRGATLGREGVMSTNSPTDRREKAAVIELVHSLSSPDAKERGSAAFEIQDLHKDLEENDVQLIARVLILARLHETDEECQQAQLGALCDLSGWHTFPVDVLNSLYTIDRAALQGSQRHALLEIIENQREKSRRLQ